MLFLFKFLNIKILKKLKEFIKQHEYPTFFVILKRRVIALRAQNACLAPSFGARLTINSGLTTLAYGPTKRAWTSRSNIYHQVFAVFTKTPNHIDGSLPQADPLPHLPGRGPLPW